MRSNAQADRASARPRPAPRAGGRRPAAAGPAAFEPDRLIHEPIRLRIMSALSVHDSLSFSDLKKAVEATDGNLSVHARRLEEAGYVRCTKSFEGRVPKTEFALMPAGRRAFERYLDHMEALVRSMRHA